MEWTLSRPGRVLLAALSAGSGVIHLVMVRSRASEWPPEGFAFGAVGALQLLRNHPRVPGQVALRGGRDHQVACRPKDTTTTRVREQHRQAGPLAVREAREVST
jgi:hypothetical protein